jgi:arylsulfatase A-like enzyme
MDDQDGPANVLFVVMDTVRKDHLTPYGYDEPTTPTLGAFAEEAAVYEEAVSPAPWTLPVHASLFTGEYPSEHGASQETPYLEGATTLAETLSAAGYDTACYSSNAWITPYTNLTDGFDDRDNFFGVMPGDLLSGPLARAWKTMNDSDLLRGLADTLVDLGNRVHEFTAGSGGDESKTPAAVDRIQGFVDGSAGPWFAFTNLMDAHLPYYPPEAFREEFAPGVDPDGVCQNSKEYNAGARDIDDEEWAAIRGLYDAEIAHMDDQLGRLFDWLQDEGYWEDTTVVVCADHGELHGEHDLYGHEFCLYDPLINVPTMVKHPAVETGHHDEQFELQDLYHTVLDATGVDPDEVGIDGAVGLAPARSLLREGHRQFEDGSASGARGSASDRGSDGGAGPPGAGELAFVEYTRPVVELNQLENKAAAAGIELDEQSRFYSRMRAVRRPDAKYVRNERIDDEFYRLDEDPGETENRHGDGDDAGTALETALSAFEAARGGAWTGEGDQSVAGGEDALDDMDDETKDRLRDLGYVD